LPERLLRGLLARPEALLDPAVRGAPSMWALLEPGVEERIAQRLATALDSGAWDAQHSHLCQWHESRRPTPQRPRWADGIADRGTPLLREVADAHASIA
jgi:hypothetical protein